jgi:transcription-repair coupling factor (superfamily II helicase)
MYMKLLEEAVRELKGEEIEEDVRANVNLRVDLRIDESYVPDVNQRLILYRKVAAARRMEEIDRVLEEAGDRYGPVPDSLRNLADYGRIRIAADRLGIESIDREARTLVLKFRTRTPLDPTRLVAIVGRRSDLALVPPAGLKLSLDAARPQRGGRAKDAKGAGAPSWWTARARAGEVKPGFSKDEIMRPAAEDPRAAGGLFERVRDLLDELLDATTFNVGR